MQWLSQRLEFPHPDSADGDGVVAVGGDCSVARLLLAYQSGIFPWPVNRSLPMFWFSPDPRYVVVPREAHLGRSLRKQVRRGVYEVRADTAFDAVIEACARAHRPGQRGTWITPSLRAGFSALHREGYAHSIEAWAGDRLVGGLYGLSLGGAFFGESMFALEPDASKVAFAVLLGNLVHWDFAFVDAQTRTDHLARFGAIPWPRREFLAHLDLALKVPTRRGPWVFGLPPGEAIDLIPG